MATINCPNCGSLNIKCIAGAMQSGEVVLTYICSGCHKRFVKREK